MSKKPLRIWHSPSLPSKEGQEQSSTPAAQAQRALTAGNLRAQGRPLLVLMVALGLPLFWYRGFDMYYRNDPSKYSPNYPLTGQPFYTQQHDQLLMVGKHITVAAMNTITSGCVNSLGLP